MLIREAAALIFIFGSVFSLSERDYDPFHDECAFESSARQPCGRRHDALGEFECKARGCCFDGSREVGLGVPRCFLAHRMLVEQCDVAYEDKDDCGYYGMVEGACLVRGCCWRPSTRVNDPECFHPGKAPIRLIDSDGNEAEREGRVEILHDEEWGTVCDDAFTNTDARVVCRQLGFDNGVSECCAAFGSGHGAIWMDEVSCTGRESALEDCQHNGWGKHDCGHSEDASVMCYNDGDPLPYYTTTPYPTAYYYHSYDGMYPEYSGYYNYKAPKKPGKKKGRKHGKKKNLKGAKKWVHPPATRSATFGSLKNILDSVKMVQ